jgi:purine-binding chemotaxis protein CheW
MAVSEITDTRQYLTFKLDEEVFAVDVAQVREILELIPITKVPKTPDFMRGVINVRGSVVPVVDLRLRFGIQQGQETINTCIVVMEVGLDGDNTVIGAIADSVQEVSEFSPEQIEPPPKLGTQLNVDFIKGIGKQSEKFVIILDIDRIFSSSELQHVASAGETAVAQEEAAQTVHG